MRTYNDREKQIISQLLDAAKAGAPLHMEDVLRQFYFREKEGRALIIQTKGEYAVFFLNPALSDNEANQENEKRDFLGLIALLRHLNDAGYIKFSANENKKEMYYIQDGFDAPEIIGNDRIVLNKKGDYSLAPETIRNSKGEIIYRGITFCNYKYAQILNTTVGHFTVSDKLAGLLQEAGPPQAGKESGAGGINNNKEEINNDNMKTTKEKENEDLRQAAIPQRKLLSRCMSGLFILLCIASCLSGGYYLHLRTGDMEQRMEQAGIRLAMLDSLQSAMHALRHTHTLTAAEDEDTVIPPAGTYGGIDLSLYRRNDVQSILPDDGIRFIIFRATEGARHSDTHFRENWRNCRRKGFVLGVYHAYRTKDNPVQQAEFFLRTVAAQGQADMAPIVNIEEESLAGDMTSDPEKIQDELSDFLRRIEDKSGRTPIIYTNRYFANKYLLNGGLSRYPLWLADYTRTDAPVLPGTWKKTGCLIRQKRYNYSSGPEWAEPTDFEVFTGNLSDLVQ
jgi:GH25 family lysozyme M1 (1,4-beta-N-acetylmuramidase)